MSKRGVRFVERWVSEWVHPTTYLDEDGLEARQYAVQCLAAAEAEGISKKEIEEDLGNIVGYMTGAINSQIDEEVARLGGQRQMMPWPSPTVAQPSVRGDPGQAAFHDFRRR